ncbi:MAG: 50S ribosomal protein L15 [Rickettsiales bacterium]|jgi:large subunit ribosomal protein L15|nr:50S ribosomal protein L15 [Rickettsiales bacterium]
MEIKLNTIRDKKSASKARLRVGRGIGSGKGKTSGRGNKGQKSRSGVSITWFEGGQSPLYRRLPKRGFNNDVFKKQYALINLGRIEELVAAKLISDKVSYDILRKIGEIESARDGLKVLARGELKSKVDVEAAVFSAAARAAIEKAGGQAVELKKQVQEGKKKKLDKPAKTKRIEKKKAAKKEK